MGFFSWKTSDTNKTIWNVHSGKPTFEVHMITRDGAVFTEDEYDGYGVFDGMDYFSLVDLINGGDGDRIRGIELAFGDGDIRLPKLVEHLPSEDNWEEEFDLLPDSNRCSTQGYWS